MTSLPEVTNKALRAAMRKPDQILPRIAAGKINVADIQEARSVLVPANFEGTSLAILNSARAQLGLSEIVVEPEITRQYEGTNTKVLSGDILQELQDVSGQVDELSAQWTNGLLATVNDALQLRETLSNEAGADTAVKAYDDLIANLGSEIANLERAVGIIENFAKNLAKASISDNEEEVNTPNLGARTDFAAAAEIDSLTTMIDILEEITRRLAAISQSINTLKGAVAEKTAVFEEQKKTLPGILAKPIEGWIDELKRTMPPVTAEMELIQAGLGTLREQINAEIMEEAEELDGEEIGADIEQVIPPPLPKIKNGPPPLPKKEKTEATAAPKKAAPEEKPAAPVKLEPVSFVDGSGKADPAKAEEFARSLIDTPAMQLFASGTDAFERMVIGPLSEMPDLFSRPFEFMGFIEGKVVATDLLQAEIAKGKNPTQKKETLLATLYELLEALSLSSIHEFEDAAAILDAPPIK